MIILSLGSNLPSKFGDKFENIKIAINLIESSGIVIEKKSSLYETPSYPDSTKPQFVNIIISIKTNLNPVDLMIVLLHIEKKMDRKRNKKNDPRTCDIDIIDYNGQVLEFKIKDLKLKIPHEKLSNRNFVLFPLEEIIPDWKHPKTKENISAIIHKLPEEDRKAILKIKKS